MTTLLVRDPGPDKRFEMSENSALPGRRPPTDAKRLTWIPAVASLLAFLIGISDILAVFKPDLHEKLHKVNAVVPGTLTNVTRTSDVIIGLLLLMLARGLRRRKRRAWQAVLVLLAFDIVVHFMHFPRIVSVSGIVAIVLLAVLLYRHEDFYAVGDPRTRRTVVQVFVGLVVMDFAIGLGYLALGPLAGDYTVPQRLQDVLYELVGVYGPVQWASDARGDLYHLLTSTARSRWWPPFTCSSARRGRARGSPPWTRSRSARCSTGTATGTHSATSPCATTRA
jgi:lysyl-tRNA synthetase, class II